MKTRGDFTIHYFRIEFQKFGEPIYLLPFGDVHKSSPMHHAEKWAEYLEWAKTKPRSYFLGMGDFDDLASTSERLVLGDASLHDSTIKTLEELYLNNVKKFCKDIEFMKGRLIGLMGGNHYGVFSNGMTTDQKMCEILKCKYLGVNTFIRLSFIKKGNKSQRMSVDIFAHHGRGSGRTVGASLNPVHAMGNIAEADIYLMGDNHQKDLAHKEKLKLVTSRVEGVSLTHRKQLFARTGSYLKGYEENTQSYVVDALLPPSDLGSIKIELTPQRIRKNGEDALEMDIHASV